MVSMMTPDQSEVLSTEELLGEVERVTKMANGMKGRLMVGSIDVKALYPSLNIEESAEICERAIIESQ